MIDRCPNMLRHDWPTAGPCATCGASFAEGAGTPCPGKPKAEQTPTPRIDLQTGDAVSWSTAGKGTIRALYEHRTQRLIASVAVEGWFWHVEDECYTTEDTGHPATLEIRAADLSRKGGA